MKRRKRDCLPGRRPRVGLPTLLGGICVLFLGLACLPAVSALEADVNLALNKPVQAKNAQPSYPAAYAVDGNLNTFWVSGGVSTANPTYLVVDLGESKVFNFSMFTNSGNAGGSPPLYESPKAGRIEGSNNAEAWTNPGVDSNWTPIAEFSYENRAGSFITTFAPVSYRYVRLYVWESWYSNVQIKEWELRFNTNYALSSLGATIVSDASHPDASLGDATKLIDGNDASYWIAGRSPTQGAYHLTITLPQPEYVDTVRLFKQSSAAEALGPKRAIGYRLFIWAGGQWLKVYETANDGGLAEAVCRFPGAITNQVQLEVTATVNNAWGYLCSFEVKGLGVYLDIENPYFGQNGATIQGRARPNTPVQLTVEPGGWTATQSAGVDGLLTFTGVQFTEGVNTLKLHSLDPYTPLPDSEPVTVYFDPHPLQVIPQSASPVRLNEGVEIKFSKTVQRTTINENTVKLLGAQGEIPARVSYNEANNTAIIHPEAKLAPETEYTVVVTTGVKGVDNIPLTQEFQWRFNTTRQFWRLLTDNKNQSDAYATGGTYRLNPAPTIYPDAGTENSFAVGHLTDGSNVFLPNSAVAWGNTPTATITVDLKQSYRLQELRLSYFSSPPPQSGYSGPYTDRKLEKMTVYCSLDGNTWWQSGFYQDLISNNYSSYWAALRLQEVARYLKIVVETSTYYLIPAELEIWGDGPGVDCEAPRLTQISPEAGTIVEAETIPVEVEYQDDIGIATEAVQLWLDNLEVTSAVQVGATSLSYLIPVAQATSGEHRLRVKVQDTSGYSVTQEWAFTIDGPPQVSTLTPENGATLASRLPLVKATYQDLGSGVDPAKVRLWLDGEEVTAQARITDQEIDYQPEAALTVGKHWLRLVLVDQVGKMGSTDWEFTITEAAGPGGFRIEVPATIEATVPFTFTVIAEDASGHVYKDFNGEITLKVKQGDFRLLEQGEFREGKAVCKGLSNIPGTLQLEVQAKNDPSLSGQTPAFFVDRPPRVLQTRVLQPPGRVSRHGEEVETVLFVNQAGTLQITVCDLEGRQVFSQEIPVTPGEFTVRLPSKDRRGRDLRSGLYVVQLSFRSVGGEEKLRLPLLVHYVE